VAFVTTCAPQGRYYSGPKDMNVEHANVKNPGNATILPSFVAHVIRTLMNVVVAVTRKEIIFATWMTLAVETYVANPTIVRVISGAFQTHVASMRLTVFACCHVESLTMISKTLQIKIVTFSSDLQERGQVSSAYSLQNVTKPTKSVSHQVM